MIQREGGEYCRSLIGGVECQGAAGHQYALAHAGEAKAAAYPVDDEADAIVGDLHCDSSRVDAQHDVDSARAGVLGDVGERLLNEPV